MADDTLANCRSLVELLADAVRRTRETTSALRVQEEALEAEGASLAASCLDVREAAVEVTGALADMRARTTSGLVELEQSAREHQQAVAAMGGTADALEGQAAVELEEAERAVDAAFDRLAEEAVAALEAELAAKSEELVAASLRAAPDVDAVAPAYAAADETLADETVRTDETLAALRHGLEDARAAVGEGWHPLALLDAIERAASAGADAFAEKAAAWGLELALAGEALHEGVGQLSEDAGIALTAARAVLERAAAALENERPRLLIELEQAAADLEAAWPALDAASAAAARIPEITANIEWIQQVLAALDGQ
jgi:hypothetical protein